MKKTSYSFPISILSPYPCQYSEPLTSLFVRRYYLSKITFCKLNRMGGGIKSKRVKGGGASTSLRPSSVVFLSENALFLTLSLISYASHPSSSASFVITFAFWWLLESNEGDCKFICEICSFHTCNLEEDCRYGGILTRLPFRFRQNYGRQSLGHSILVRGSPMGPIARFPFFSAV